MVLLIIQTTLVAAAADIRRAQSGAVLGAVMISYSARYVARSRASSPASSIRRRASPGVSRGRTLRDDHHLFHIAAVVAPGAWTIAGGSY